MVGQKKKQRDIYVYTYNSTYANRLINVQPKLPNIVLFVILKECTYNYVSKR